MRDVTWTVDLWNRAAPVGTKVVLTDDRGEQHQTRTRSLAWSMCGSPVVMVEGRSGGYLCERLRIVDEGEGVAA